MKKYYILLIPLFALALLVGCGKQPATGPTETPPSPEAAAPPTVSPSAPAPAGFDGTLLSGKHTVILHTSKGDITLELDADNAPKTVTNFVVLGQTGYFNGLTFHRVIPDFMIQGGDPKGDGTGGESVFGPTFEDEVEGNPIPLVRSVIAMANRGPNTNGSQFFIITRAEGTPWLVGKHTPFGRVTQDMEVVDAISDVPKGERERPLEPITFTVEVVN
jgi:cyclophilin family peptidyl-prolyl cis-trans isomerase